MTELDFAIRAFQHMAERAFDNLKNFTALN